LKLKILQKLRTASLNLEFTDSNKKSVLSLLGGFEQAANYPERVKKINEKQNKNISFPERSISNTFGFF